MKSTSGRAVTRPSYTLACPFHSYSVRLTRYTSTYSVRA